MGSGSSRRRGAAAAAGGAAVPAVRAAAENQLLLERVLAECEEAAALAAPGYRAPAAGRVPPPRDAGRSGQAATGAGAVGPPLEQAALSSRSPPGPGNTTTDHQCPQRNSKKPSGQSAISYDYSEEELMASIEREYCR